MTFDEAVDNFGFMVAVVAFFSKRDFIETIAVSFTFDQLYLIFLNADSYDKKTADDLRDFALRKMKEKKGIMIINRWRSIIQTTNNEKLKKEASFMLEVLITS